MIKQLTGSVLLISGTGTLGVLAFLLVNYAEIDADPGLALSGTIALLLGLLGVWGLYSGTQLRARRLIALGEVSVIVGAFLLGVASRGDVSEADLLGVFGLFMFTIGYLIVQRTTDKKRIAAVKLAATTREETLRRILGVCPRNSWR